MFFPFSFKPFPTQFPCIMTLKKKKGFENTLVKGGNTGKKRFHLFDQVNDNLSKFLLDLAGLKYLPFCIGLAR